MPSIYELESVELDFFDNARYRVRQSIDINCSVARMMEALKDNEQWAQWASPIKKAVWTSESRTKNCTRDVYLVGGILLKERFFQWNEGSRVSFCVTSTNIPGLKKFAEDHSITWISDKKTQLDLTVAFEMRGQAQLIAPLMFSALNIMIPRMLKNYKRLLEDL